MGNFQKGANRGGFRGGFGGGKPSFRDKGGYGNDRGPVTMHKATCSECGKTCEVPFRPTGEKPVFCNDCFASKRGGDDRGGDRRPSRDFGDRAPRREFNNDRPRGRDDFKPAPTGGDVKKELNEISIKLDRLISAMERLTQPAKKETAVISPVVETSAKAKKAVKKPELKAVVKKVMASKGSTKKAVAKKKK